ncbi:hypothetical protein ACQKKK_01525 [Peribacillus sp. NPDC006672]|uniref:hypothetical protein n=1 Tax=Peribacillus sp. NPDC006672 TaxID=3390606 RepID=UPI003CFDBBFF
MNTIISVFIVLFIFALVIKLEAMNHKARAEERPKLNKRSKRMETSRNSKIDKSLYFFLFALTVDLMIVLFAIKGYYFIPVKSTGDILPLLLTVIAFYMLARARNLGKFWVILVTVLLVLFLVMKISLLKTPYASVSSPSGKETVIIGHRDATLGETNHFYTFYRKTAVPGVMKKMNQGTLNIMTRGTLEGDLEVLGVDNAKWIDGELVIFSSAYAETRLELN